MCTIIYHASVTWDFQCDCQFGVIYFDSDECNHYNSDIIHSSITSFK